MNFLQRMVKARQQQEDEIAKMLEKSKKESTVETTRTLSKTMQEERVMKVPEVVKNIGLEK